MIRNYFTTAVRSLLKNFSYSLINIFGLSIGLASFLLIVIWINHEVSYDKHHIKADRIYRSSMEFSFGGMTVKSSLSPTAMLPALMSFPEVESAAKIFRPGNFRPPTVKVGEEMFLEHNLFYADSSVFDIFTYTFLKGTKEALYLPDGAALSESTAKKYYGDEDPIGRVIEVGKNLYTVKAVYRDMPQNSHFHADLFIPFSSHSAANQRSWGSANYNTYFILQENSSPSELNDKINELLRSEYGREMTNDSYVKINFLPARDIHLYSNADSEIEPTGNPANIYIFSAIAFLILFIACINYMNLASAKATERAREVGVRKVMGAYRVQLFGQFIGEAFILTFIAALISLLLVNLSVPVFSHLSGFEFSLLDILSPYTFMGFFFIIVVVALLAGSYPALMLSGFNPQTVLKGAFAYSKKGVLLRKSLVVLQFIITVILITSTLIIYQQLEYVQDKNLGYEKDLVVELPFNKTVNDNFEKVAGLFKEIPAVEQVTRGSDSPVNSGGGYSINIPKYEEGNSMMITGLATDEDYIKTMGMEVIKGRDFYEGDWNRLQDTTYSFIINETAQQSLLLSDDEVIGLKANLNGRRGEIVGVVKDFHFSGLQNKITPLILFLEPQFNKVFVKLNTTQNISETLAVIEEKWIALIPGTFFHYKFLDDDYAALYQSEMRLGKLFFVFATLAIFIACLGLFGLISYMAVQKSKEVGVRKILGASVSNLVLLLTKDFVRLIFIAFMLSSPLAWIIMSKWLESFAYKITIGIIPFLLSALMALAVAIITISYQSYKAAISDPVNSLRSE